MTTTRQHKVSRLLQKELGEYFQRQGPEITGGKMVTVTVVRISPDLGVAKVYLSIFPAEEADKAVRAISEKAGMVRSQLGRKLRSQLRHIPEFSYFLDDSLDYIDRIDGLLKDD
ncbi:MAG: 30S ribosome-binding factor RbfA [Bacteroidales bacterium]|nr:30S ribosome-binding factor RbfA [Bacteroidales bacterium]